MNDRSTQNQSVLPAGACDTHIHFYDARFPASRTSILYPPDASPSDYRDVQVEIGLDRLVVVQPTTYGIDNSCQLDAMVQFGDRARGVMVVDHETTRDELEQLTELGVCGARFHMLPGGAVPWEMLEPVAERIAEVGWHIQLQMNGRELDAYLDRLLELPVDLVVDHVGRFMPPGGVNHAGFQALLTLLNTGGSWVKLSAPYESSVAGPPDYDDVRVLIDELVSRFPERLLWASNWPHPGQANPPTPRELSMLLNRWLPDGDVRQRVLVDNPAELYRF
ncbi:MAG: amidohydrolase family protein [Acidimicrobiales bacterium]